VVPAGRGLLGRGLLVARAAAAAAAGGGWVATSAGLHQAQDGIVEGHPQFFASERASVKVFNNPGSALMMVLMVSPKAPGPSCLVQR
jgi:hypothetical protein